MNSSAKKILVVSANAKVRDLAAFAFDVVARWAVVSASSITECLAVTASDAPDAILIDSHSCGADVMGVIEKLAQVQGSRPVPILLLQPARQVHFTLNFHPLPQGTISESLDPRKLALEVGQVLGWQPWTITHAASDALAPGC